MDTYEVTMKLIGPVEPVGETNMDNDRYENLKDLTNLTNQLLTVIDSIANQFQNNHQYSMKRAAVHCNEFLDGIGIPRD